MEIAPCRYRVPFVTHRGESDSLALTVIYLTLLNLPVSGSGNTDIICFLRLLLHGFQLSSLLNGSQSHEPRKSGERRARLPLSDLYLLSSHLPYGSMHTSNILMVSINLLLTLKISTCYIKKKALLLYISFSTI